MMIKQILLIGSLIAILCATVIAETPYERSKAAEIRQDDAVNRYVAAQSKKRREIATNDDYKKLESVVIALETSLGESDKDEDLKIRTKRAMALASARADLNAYVSKLLDNDKELAALKAEMIKEKELAAITQRHAKAEQDDAWLQMERRLRLRKKPVEVIEAGAQGTLTEGMTIVSIVDASNMIAAYKGRVVWLRGWSTKGLADDQPLSVSSPIVVSGTQSYATAGGAKKTVFVIEPAQ